MPFPQPLSDLAILYHDAAIVVVNKPSLLLSVPGKGPEKQDSVASRVQQQFADALIVHRLDWETSGLMVLGRGKDPHRELSRQFHDRQTDKTYLAEVAGQMNQDEGEINLPMRCDIDHRPRQIVDFEHGKPALTRFRVLQRQPDRSRLELKPVTGRSHQLRVHMMSIGHPILGDGLYASAQQQTMSERLLLHAVELAFTHPINGQRLTFHCPAPF